MYLQITEKKCSRCEQTKPITEFHRDNSMKVGYKSWCKQCVKEEYQIHREKRYETTKRWKVANKDKCNTYDKTAKGRKYEFVESLKTPCVKCGEDRTYVIEFHHIDPSTKLFNIAKSTRNNNSLLEESKKCVCLCANCHKEFHYLYGMHPDKPKDSLDDYLNGGVVSV